MMHQDQPGSNHFSGINTGYNSFGDSMGYGASDSTFSDPGQQEILDILGASSNDMGLSVDQIRTQINGRVNDADIRYYPHLFPSKFLFSYI